MIPVEFIKLEKPEKARHCCILAEEYFNQGKRVLIVVKDQEQGQILDRFMWTWRKTSFIPHALFGEEEDCATVPVIISTDHRRDFSASILIMAAPCPVDFIRCFEQACDFAELYDSTLHQDSRRRFALYREQGLEPRMRQ